MSRISENHPLALMLRDLIHKAVVRHIDSRGQDDVEAYLAGLMLDFLHADRMNAIRDKGGSPIWSLGGLVDAGDITSGADSFEREREVHKHLGDLLLFGTGVFPEMVRALSLQPPMAPVYPVAQGRESYAIVSTFDHGAWANEAATFRRLSDGFEDFAFVLGDVGRSSGLLRETA
jgi:hypothetical protein